MDPHGVNPLLTHGAFRVPSIDNAVVAWPVRTLDSLRTFLTKYSYCKLAYFHIVLFGITQTHKYHLEHWRQLLITLANTVCCSFYSCPMFLLAKLVCFCFSCIGRDSLFTGKVSFPFILKESNYLWKQSLPQIMSSLIQKKAI